ncbi:LysR family transcriptional regulator [Bordetella sp. 02P26C-1]|uniref:LysR family transcriptional regulator n=1 Tax=Bordetella sp. 02P26C-1 TaxID=2683195 RepID=UPI0013534AE5|nr:LysR family transcriptional regulator [Bordetella sp. 02P26C-1]MVW77831.1 LysR family transcriptional regulator [Bordetella sp. 02P26C-1]
MQIKDLQWFIRTVELGSIHSAARELEISQPALSKSLQRLEAMLGVRILERTPKGVEVTEVGLALVERARMLEDWLRGTRMLVEDYKAGAAGELRIGAAPTIVDPMLSGVLATFVLEGPPARFYTNVQLTQHLLQQLETGDLDFAIGSIMPGQMPAALNHIKLGLQRHYIVGREGHPLMRQSFTIADLQEQPWVVSSNSTLRGWVENMFHQQGLAMPRVFIQSDVSPGLFSSLFERSDVLTLMTTDSLNGSLGKGLRPLPKPAPTWSLQLGLFWRRSAYFSNLKELFRRRVIEAFDARPREPEV